MLINKKIILTLLVFILIPLVLAMNFSTVSYSINKTHLGISGGNSSTNNYQFSSTTTHQQPGNINTSTDSYLANIGWFHVSKQNISEGESEESEEDEEDTSQTPSTGGGGETPTPKKTEEKFELNKDLLKVSTKVGETFKTSFKIENLEENDLNLNLSTNMEEKIIFSENDFTINPKETKEIEITFYSTPDSSPDVYSGKIFIASENQIKEIDIILEIESKQILFDIDLDVPAKFKELFPGEEILAHLTLFNLGDVGKVDAGITFLVKNFEGETISSQEETVAVETQASLSRKIVLPKDLEAGRYAIVAKVIYGDSVGTSSDVFHIISKEKKKDITIVYFIIFGIFILLAIIGLFEFYQRKLKKSLKEYKKNLNSSSKKINKNEKETIESNKKDRELKEKLQALKKAYKEKTISKDSYKKGKERIEKERKKLKRKYL